MLYPCAELFLPGYREPFYGQGQHSSRLNNTRIGTGLMVYDTSFACRYSCAEETPYEHHKTSSESVDREEASMRDLHTLAIVLHAASATGVFVIGIVLVFQNRVLLQLRLARAAFILLLLMEVFLVVAILSHVNSLPTLTQGVFGGLALLGVYMLWRAFQALSVLQEAPGNQVAVIDHIGFILISLFDGFAIVSSIDLHAPGWLIAVIAVGAVASGVFALHVRKNTLLRVEARSHEGSYTNQVRS